ncbi:hypothetical protein J437_LFUL012386 [Ladona fulva]|uniref:Reverse transcriptase domain-containing protein n=1 Tax=Ladona fulva TaxID=123851 RepID=A0A8K0P610_LADFU|nr:hypothetical protein J437_LFUL012386 [Ladona fulva]
MCRDYRPITLTTTDYKILAKVIKERIQIVVEDIIEKEQYALSKKRNIVDALTLVRDIVQLLEKKKQEENYIVAIDIEKAFDSISINFIINVLQRYGIPKKLVNLIKEFNTNLRGRVKIGQNLTEEFEIKQSIRQGCPLSMLLFAIGLDPLIRRLKDRINGINIEGNNHKMAVYADDITILINNIGELQDLEAIFESYRKISGLTVNRNKTQVLRLGGRNILGGEMRMLSEEVKILGIKWKSTIQETIERNWEEKVNKNRKFFFQQRARNSNLLEQIIIINDIALAQLWYVLGTGVTYAQKN